MEKEKILIIKRLKQERLERLNKVKAYCANKDKVKLQKFWCEIMGFYEDGEDLHASKKESLWS